MSCNRKHDSEPGLVKRERKHPAERDYAAMTVSEPILLFSKQAIGKPPALISNHSTGTSAC